MRRMKAELAGLYMHQEMQVGSGRVAWVTYPLYIQQVWQKVARMGIAAVLAFMLTAVGVRAVAGVPTISVQPQGGMMLYGSSIDLSVAASGSPAPSYQWQWNGAAVAGATSPTYTASAPGLYSVLIWNSTGSVTSSPATVKVGNRLGALSCRAFVGADAAIEIAGFVVAGPAGTTKPILIRGAGPALSQLGVSGVLSQPVLTLFDSTGSVVATNTGWSAAANAAQIATTTTAVGEFAFPANSGDSALLANLAPGGYTAQIAGVNRTSGVGLLEVYEADGGDAQLTAISVRAMVGTGAAVQIAGISIGGNLPSKVLVRGVGPGLAQYGVGNFLAKPQLAVIDADGNTIASNSGWSNNGNAAAIAAATAAVGDFALTSGSADAALLLNLQPGAYTVIISGANGTTGVALAEVYQSALDLEPQIAGQPASQSVTVGQPAAFSVGATGSAPFTYQWSRNGNPIAGATASSYIIPAAGMTDNGAVFIAAVANSSGATTSKPATLTVAKGQLVVAPQILSGPISQTVLAGQTATFGVSASGTDPLIYQWARGGTLIAGANAPTYTTPPSTTADSGTVYTVTVSNAGGAVTSPNGILTVNPGAAAAAPQITNQPQSVTVNSGQGAAFVVAATGTGPLSYQWFRGPAPIAGATGNSYTLSLTAPTDNGAAFNVLVSNAAGTATSQTAFLTVRFAPQITIQPGNLSVGAGQNAAFSVSAAGTAPITYQWVKNGVWVTGALGANYTTAPVILADNGAKYTVIVANAVGSVVSQAGILTVTAIAPPIAPQITAPPVSQTVNAGASATFTVTASGSTPLTYQWYKAGTALNGATAASYTTGATTSADNASSFTVAIANSAGTVTSPAALLTVISPPVIATQPVNRSVTVGQSASFSVVANGSAPLAYQWYKGNVALAGAISSLYTTPATVPGDSGASYKVTITNPAGSVTSNSVLLTVNAAANNPVTNINITTIPLVLYGSSLQLTGTPVDAAGNGVAGKVLSWTSADATIAVVTGAGMATGARAGFTTVTATVDGVSATARISVMGPVAIPTRSKYVGTNLEGMAYYSTEFPFVDLMKTSGGFWYPAYVSGTPSQPGNFPSNDGFYPTSLYPGEFAETIGTWGGGNQLPNGQYVLLWDGDGDMGINAWGTSIVSSQPNRMVLDVEGGSQDSGIYLRIYRTNPQNPLHNVRLLLPGTESTYLTQPFNTAFLRKTAPFSVIRFMDWAQTNGSTIIEWADRVPLNSPTYTLGPGAPIESMVQLANTLHTNPWICIPVMASDDFVRQLATYLRANLDPGLKAYIEYSNEVWNWGFSQTSWAVNQSYALGLDTPWGTPSIFYGRRVTQIFKIFSAVYGGELGSRVVRVLGGQAGWTQFQSFALGYADTAANVDALAIAPYFSAGGDLSSTTDELFTNLYSSVRNDMRQWITQNATLAQQYNIKMIGYESGVGDSSAGWGQPNANTMLGKYVTVNNDPRMHDVYTEFWNLWVANGGDVMNQYDDVGYWTVWGLWGALQNIYQDPATSPKYQALIDFIAAHPTTTP